ncbi:uracil-DNA glycosylase family protein [Phocaeicola oris]|uniref:uracil-DNA glycosylase family protein n=1 Tax=Phocaeicola oris TaxID=2896850 RepID=UPI00234F22A4|nr:uracil-DNA glycosylase family protein [Phocaeicola oris]MCE2615733.1 uracil-DNA glycosylase family protein [Phocaeicola oris]
MDVEQHPFKPFLPVNAQLLMLGSFPPQPKRWKMNFYYPNFINDMWRIFGLIFFGDKNHFIIPDQKIFDEQHLIQFLNEKGVALFDTAMTIRRLKDNASDKFLEIVQPTDIPDLLEKIPQCKAIVTTGEKATETLQTQIQVAIPKVGTYETFRFNNKEMRLYRMPSSSRAYPMSVENKANIYRKMFEDLEML